MCAPSLWSLSPLRWLRHRRLAQALRGLAGAACISLLALGLTGGAPVLHMALLMVLLMGAIGESAVRPLPASLPHTSQRCAPVRLGDLTLRWPCQAGAK